MAIASFFVVAQGAGSPHHSRRRSSDEPEQLDGGGKPGELSYSFR